MCKLHEVRFIKGTKTFESMLKNTVLSDKTAKGVISQHRINCQVLLFKLLFLHVSN